MNALSRIEQIFEAWHETKGAGALIHWLEGELLYCVEARA